MKAIRHILHHSITLQFYKQHAGLFLFSFFILFGIQPSAADLLQFHYSIILSILHSVTFYLVALAVWTLYTVKVALFVRACLKKESYDFVYQLQAVAYTQRLLQLSRMLAWMMSPVFAYALLVMLIGVFRHSWLSVSAILAAVVLLFVLLVAFVKLLVSKGKDNQFMQKIPGLLFVRPGLFSMLLQFVFRKQFITLLILKTVSFAALYFFAKTDAQVFEGRMLWLLFITVLAGHGIIIFRNVHFMENELSFYRNMPVSRWYTLFSLLGLYTLLLIPECWALKGLIIIQHELAEYGWLLLTGPALLLLIHCLLYSEDIKMEEFLALLFGIWIVFIFFSLSSMKWLMPLIGFLFGWMIFYLTYYKWEKKVENEIQE
jgi:hypothetical protein